MRAVLACFLFIFAVSCGPENVPASEISFDRQRMEIVRKDGKSLPFSVEIADTPEKQMRGLMYRTSMGPDEGMLFLYSRSKPVSMWMANTYISLDMLFIDKAGTILQIEEHTQPLSKAVISSFGPADAVLELNAGTAERLGIKAGDTAVHPFFMVEK